jgi:hypothetical protein
MDFQAFVEKQEKKRRPWLWRLIEKHMGPGPHPCGTPQSVHAGDGKKGHVQVGITSAKPGKSLEQIEKELGEFKAMMKKTPVKNLSVELGTGGWEGGSEPTFVTQYEGNGEARRILAEKAKAWNQDAVILMRYVRSGGQPQTRISFGEALTEEECRTVEAGLLQISGRHGAGIGGWTWGQGANGQPELIMQCIPHWGGNAKNHSVATKELSNQLGKMGYKVTHSELWVEVEVWEKGDYDRILAGKAG